MLALALILQAYMGISDDEVIEATLMDRRWQLVLDCLDTDQAPFSKGTLVGFRQRLIAAQLDRRLIERTIEIAAQSQAFGSRPLRAALDSSPLWGAGRVEDTYNLIGHALKKVIRVVADQQGRELMEVGKEAGAEVVCGTSLKAALDLDTGLIRAVGITPANISEASVTREISADLERQGVSLKELHIDRAYLSSHLVRERSDELEVYCKAWPVRISKHFHKRAFVLDW